MKKKLLFGLIALFGYLLNATAGDDWDSMFKKYRKGKEQEIVYVQRDIQKELRKAKAGKGSEDIDIDELQRSAKRGIHKAQILICFRLGNMFDMGNIVKPESMPDIENITEELNSESTDEFMNDFAQLRENMLNDTSLSHAVLNKNNCNVDLFLPVGETSTIKDAYLFIKMINGSLNCLLHFSGKLKIEMITEAIEDGSLIKIDGFEPTYSITTE